jgi:MFS family permease
MARSPHAALILTFALGGFASAFAMRLTDPLVQVLSDHFGEDPSRTALLATAFALPFALLQPILGPVADAVGKRRVIACALGLQALCLMGSAFAPTLLVLLVLRAMTGAAGGGVFPSTLALFGDRVPLAERQLAISRFLVCAVAGQMMGGTAAGLLEPYLGWRGLMALCAVLSGGGALIVLRDRTPEPWHRIDLGQAVTRYKYLLTHRPALTLFWAVATEGLLLFSGFPYFASHLYETGIGGTREAGLTVGAFGGGGFLYTMLAPYLLRNLGQRRMMRLGASLAATGLGMIALAPWSWLFVMAGGVMGLGFFMLHNSLQTRVTEIAPQFRASAVSLHAFHFFLGQSIGPVLLAVTRGYLGFSGGLLLNAAGLVILGMYMGRAKNAS